MRKQIILFALVFISSFLMAQESDIENSRKQIFLGGSINFNTNNGGSPLFITSLPASLSTLQITGSRTTNFSISPYIGGVQNEHWDFGIGFGISVNKTTDLATGNVLSSQILFFDQTTSGFSFYTFGRYKLNPNNKVKFFLQPNIGVGLTSRSIDFQDNSTQANDDNYAQANIGVSAGILYEVNSRFRLLANLGNFSALIGKHTISDTDFSENYNSVGLNFGTSSLRIGGEVIF